MFQIDLKGLSRTEIGRRPISLATITIGAFTENFAMSVEYWDVARYLVQWQEGLGRLVSTKHDRSAIVGSIGDPKLTEYLMWWPLYTFGGDVIVHRQLLMFEQLHEPFNEENLYSYIDDYSAIDEDGNRLSEWRCSLQDLKAFLSKVPELSTPAS